MMNGKDLEGTGHGLIARLRKNIKTKSLSCPRFKQKYRISRPIRRTVIYLLEILGGKKNDECILILVIYWKKTGLLHTKISTRI